MIQVYKHFPAILVFILHDSGTKFLYPDVSDM